MHTHSDTRHRKFIGHHIGQESISGHSLSRLRVSRFIVSVCVAPFSAFLILFPRCLAGLSISFPVRRSCRRRSRPPCSRQVRRARTRARFLHGPANNGSLAHGRFTRATGTGRRVAGRASRRRTHTHSRRRNADKSKKSLSAFIFPEGSLPLLAVTDHPRQKRFPLDRRQPYPAPNCQTFCFLFHFPFLSPVVLFWTRDAGSNLIGFFLCRSASHLLVCRFESLPALFSERRAV